MGIACTTHIRMWHDLVWHVKYLHLIEWFHYANDIAPINPTH